MTTWTSLRSPDTNVGRSGRSISRQVRIASVEGRPSRRKNEPGMRPAAYIRSSTSTGSGKKSKLSFGRFDAGVAGGSGAAGLEGDVGRAEGAVVEDGGGLVDPGLGVDGGR